MTEKKTSTKKKEVCPTCNNSYANLKNHKCKKATKIATENESNTQVKPQATKEDTQIKQPVIIENAPQANNPAALNPGAPVTVNEPPVKLYTDNELALMFKEAIYDPELWHFYTVAINDENLKKSFSAKDSIFELQAMVKDMMSNKEKEKAPIPKNDLELLLKAFYDKMRDSPVLNYLEDGFRTGIDSRTTKFSITNIKDPEKKTWFIDLDKLGINFSNALKIACDYIGIPDALVKNGFIVKAKNEECERLLNSLIRCTYNEIQKGNDLKNFIFTKPGTDLEVLLNNIENIGMADHLINMILAQLTQKEYGLDCEQNYLVLNKNNERVPLKAKLLGINYKNVLNQLADYAGLKNIYTVRSDGKLISNKNVDIGLLKDVFLHAYNCDNLQSFSYKPSEQSAASASIVESDIHDWFKVFEDLEKIDEITNKRADLYTKAKDLQTKMEDEAIKREIELTRIQKDGTVLWVDKRYKSLTNSIKDIVNSTSDKNTDQYKDLNNIEATLNNAILEVNIYLNAIKKLVEKGRITRIT